MAPFRNRDRSNRSGRGQVEHNVLEGLPINQYREVEVTIEPKSNDAKPVDKDAWPELPMPRDAHLLPEHSQQILRAARSGRIYKPPAPPEEDREVLDEDEEPKQVQHGFTVKKWVKVPRHLEEPEPEFLAKRRKGLPSQYSANGQLPTQPTPMRETKVKKTDSEGNISVYKVLVPEGQTVEGEVQPTDTAIIEAVPAAAAPGTVVEGVGVVNAEGVVVANEIAHQTPPRRKPPPPKKKAKRGPGRGKKKVVFADGAGEQGTPASGTGSDLFTVSRIKHEGGSVEPSDGDTPMADAGEDEGSGEEGSEDDDHDEEREHSPTSMRGETPAKTSVEPTSEPPLEPLKEQDSEPVPISDAAPATKPLALPEVEPCTPAELSKSAEAKSDTKETSGRDPSSSPELPLSTMAHSRQNSLNQIPATPPIEPAASGPALAEPGPAEPTPVEPALVEPAPASAELQTDAPASEPTPELASALAEEAHAASDSEVDLLGSLERQLEKESSTSSFSEDDDAMDKDYDVDAEDDVSSE